MLQRTAALAGVLLGTAAGELARELAADDGGAGDTVSLLQGRSLPQRRGSRGASGAGAKQGARDLVLIHIPYNFGHTVEQVAMFGPGQHGEENTVKMWSYMGWGNVEGLAGLPTDDAAPTWADANRAKAAENAEVWGHLNPDLQAVSNITGCALYYTPQKYWPKAVAEKYIGDRIPFGMLRDPYERLVAFFRGNVSGYGGSYPEYMKTCDVNGAVKEMMKRQLERGDPFVEDCAFIPQAEFFDGPYGIQLPIDNRAFPGSMNKVFLGHGYPDFVIQTQDILHVDGCNDIWSGDLDEETRGMVRQVYKRDFELLCSHFGYCNPGENSCIWQVPQMCPERIMALGYEGRELHVSAAAH